jgi:hypothetical protein
MAILKRKVVYCISKKDRLKEKEEEKNGAQLGERRTSEKSCWSV